MRGLTTSETIVVPTLQPASKRLTLKPVTTYLRSDIFLGTTSFSSLLPITIHNAAQLRSLVATGDATNTDSGNADSTNDADLASESASKEKPRLIVLDTNILLHNFDVITSSKSPCIFCLPQTVYEEAKKNLLTGSRAKNFSNKRDVLSDRIQRFVRGDQDVEGGGIRRFPVVFIADAHHEKVEAIRRGIRDKEASASTSTTVNDEMDIRVLSTGKFYEEEVGQDFNVMVMTQDGGLRERCKRNGVVPVSVEDFVEQGGEVELLDDLIVRIRGEGKTRIFDDHLSKEQITVLLAGSQGDDDDGDNDSRTGCGHDNVVYRGRIRVNVTDGVGSVFCREAENGEIEIKSKRDLNRCFDGDVVAVRGGKIIGIIHSNLKASYAGALCVDVDVDVGEDDDDDDGDDDDKKKTSKTNSKNFRTAPKKVFFQPANSSIPKISLLLRDPEIYRGKKILVSIDGWSAYGNHPSGHVVHVIGDLNDVETETKVVLHEFDIPTYPFSKDILSELPSADYPIVNSEKRKDLRHLPICSIDPPGCKDIDDALHCVKLSNGNYQLGVHIADVTHFVKDNSPLDREAAKRSTSTYLVTKRLDMLPSVLTTDLCSLRGEVDRYAFSVIWEVDPNGDVVDVDFTKSIIRSIAAMTYEDAQKLLDLNDDEYAKAQGVEKQKIDGVRGLNKFAKIFRARRMAAGALTLASQEVKFKLDDEINPTEISQYKLYETNKLVEEMMLFANITVGKRILRSFPTLCVLRRHPAPKAENFTAFVDKAGSAGVKIDATTSKKLSDSLDVAEKLAPAGGEGEKGEIATLLRILVTRCMSPAKYFVAGEEKIRDWHHYGLASPIYLHFTSPIRRYADVLVHRLLAASIGYETLPSRFTAELMGEQCDIMNRRHRAAQLAGRSSISLHTKQFFLNNTTVCPANIIDIDPIKNTLTVLILKYGIEGKISLPAQAQSQTNAACHIDNEKETMDKFIKWHNSGEDGDDDRHNHYDDDDDDEYANGTLAYDPPNANDALNIAKSAAEKSSLTSSVSRTSTKDTKVTKRTAGSATSEPDLSEKTCTAITLQPSGKILSVFQRIMVQLSVHVDPETTERILRIEMFTGEGTDNNEPDREKITEKKRNRNDEEKRQYDNTDNERKKAKRKKR